VINQLQIVITRSNPISPDPRVEKVGRALIGAGYSVVALGWDRTALLPDIENRNGVPIHRLRIRAKFGKGIGNLPYLLRWQWGLWRWLIIHRAEFNMIHACDFDTIIPAIFMKMFFGKRVIYDIFDFYADHLRATPTAIKTIIRHIDLWAIGRVDAIILVDDSRKKQVSQAKPHLISIIYNSPEDILNKKAEIQSVITGELHMAYIGLLQVERGLLEMISVLMKHPEWYLDLAGFGGDEDRILVAAKEFPNIHWYGRVSYEQALQLSASADVLFATYDPKIPNHKYSSPNKIFEAMMLGKPVIVAKGTNMDRIVREAECGCIVPYGDVPALEQAIQSLADDREFARKLGFNARKAYETHYDWAIMSQRLVQLYEKVLEK
jgi:glycosyltransferase involved in cell wall biosynthesis